jgi:hypothetical protein
MGLTKVCRTKAWAQQLDPNGSSGVSIEMSFIKMSCGCVTSAVRCGDFCITNTF